MNLLQKWRCSIACLSYEIHQLHLHHNLFTDAASERHEFFFADLGIPQPRPCTALAWASLCHIDPVRLVEGKSTLALTGKFLVPFLPKIRHGEETNQSLVRTSKAHVRDSEGNIKWGNIFIGDVESNSVIEQLPHGAFSPVEWRESNNYQNPGFQFPLPPLYSFNEEGWQFGVIQNIPGMNQTLRDPMIELAKHGVPELSLLPGVPRIRRLLLRFLDTNLVREWGTAYASSVRLAFDSSTFQSDALDLASSINEFEEQRFKEEVKAKAKSAKGAKRFADFEFDLSSIDDKLKGL